MSRSSTSSGPAGPLDNARREHDEIARTMAVVDALGAAARRRRAASAAADARPRPDDTAARSRRTLPVSVLGRQGRPHPVLRVCVRVKVEGREHVPRRGPVILASNHRSFLDSIFIPLVVRRRVTFVAKAEYFDDPKTAWFFRGCGQIPIRREGGSASERALASATDVLQRRQCSDLPRRHAHPRRLAAPRAHRRRPPRAALQRADRARRARSAPTRCSRSTRGCRACSAG